jgi:FtsP/CotA-like multicopper oxidase with cupredoxin domain
LPVLPSNGLPGTLDTDKAVIIPMVMEGGAMGGLESAQFNGSRMPIQDLVENKMAWALNGVAGMTATPLATVSRGQAVVIDFVNKTAWPHAMHLHGHHILPIEQDNKPVAQPAWRDTLLVEPESNVKAAFIAENPGKWMFHCHMLEHQEAGMMTWIEVS